MGTFFRCPKEFFQSALFDAEKPVSPAIALAAIIAQVAFGYYRIEGADGSEIEIRPGEFPVNIERLKHLTGWSANKLNRFLFFLHQNEVLGRKVRGGVTIATLNAVALAALPPFAAKSSRDATDSKNDDANQEQVQQAEAVPE
jgi:hypothetical protein